MSTEKRATIAALLEGKLGKNHGCKVDINPILRNDKDVTVRFQHEGDFWELAQAGGQITLTNHFRAPSGAFFILR